MSRNTLILGTLAIASLLGSAALARRAPGADLPAEVARGKYLVKTAGCNDCHTPGYAFSGGQIEENLWLTGDRLGWRGPWGTTYASNLRLLVQNMTADQFMKHARSSDRRPPMPWFNVRDMTDADVKAIYAYLKHLGPGGTAAPAYVPPDRNPEGPFVQFPTPPE